MGWPALVVMLVASLVELHGPDGQQILLRPEHVVSLRAPRSHEHFAKGARCLLLTVDGKLLVVLDQCSDVARKMEGSNNADHHRPPHPDGP